MNTRLNLVHAVAVNIHPHIYFFFRFCLKVWREGEGEKNFGVENI